jgi:hypothetical protein
VTELQAAQLRNHCSLPNKGKRFWHLCVSRTYFRMTLGYRFSRATPYRDVIPGPLTATDMYIMYNFTHFKYSRNVNHRTRCVITCVGGVGEQRLRHKWFSTFIIKDGRYTFLFLFHISCRTQCNGYLGLFLQGSTEGAWNWLHISIYCQG